MPSDSIPRPTTKLDTFPVIAIGGSAGAVSALKDLFGHLGPDLDAAIIVSLHLPGDRESHLKAVLAAYTDLQLVNPSDSETLRPGHVFLSPPGKQVIVGHDAIHLVDSVDDQVQRQIDRLFVSTADSHGPRSAAIVLSGTSRDGTAGAVAIHEVGGVVFAQDESAEFSEMPRSVTRTGVVTAALGLEDLASAIEDFSAGASRENLAAEWKKASQTATAVNLRTAFEARFGVPLDLYRTTLIERRAQERQRILELDSAREYEQHALENPEELDALYASLLINVTGFFRDLPAFEALRDELLPDLISGKHSMGPLRCWVPGCASGEEAFSLAMILETLEERGSLRSGYSIEGTDLHPGTLEVARAGVYPIDALEGIPDEYRKRYVEARGDTLEIHPRLRERVNFSQHDLLNGHPLNNLDLVSCRNLLIYLSPKAKRKALSLLHFSLRPNGILLLGTNETRSRNSGFEWLDQGNKILRKAKGVPQQTRAFLPRVETQSHEGAQLLAAAETENSSPSRGSGREKFRLYDALLDRFMPSGFLVDRSGSLQETFGKAGDFIGLAGRRPSLLLWDLLGLSPSGPLARAIQNSANDSSPRTVSENLGADEESVQLSVEPLSVESSSPLLVLANPTAVRSDLDQEYLETLGKNLSQSRAEIERLTAELRSSTEELQAANEELVVSNEELRSSNEELQEVNTELEALNRERDETIGRLRQATSDFNGLLRSTNVGALFLGSQFDIRFFTTAAADFFGLIPDDLGRNFLPFSERFQEIELKQLLEDAKNHGERYQGEVHDREGRAFLLDVSSVNNEPEEVIAREDMLIAASAQPADAPTSIILTLVDLDRLVEARAKADRLAALVETSTELIVGLDFDGKIVQWNRGAEAQLGFPAQRIVGQRLSDICAKEDRATFENLERKALGGRIADSEGLAFTNAEGETVILAVSLSPVFVSGNLVGTACLGRDVTLRRQMEATLRENERHLRLEVDRRERFLAMLSHELRNPMNAVAAATAVLTHDEASHEAQRNAADSIQRQVGHLRRLLDDLLDVSRVTQNKLELQTKTIILQEPIRGALEATQGIARQHGVELDIRIPEKPIAVHGDPDRLQQMVSNLLGNAIKFADPENGHVSLRVEQEEGGVVLVFKDNGSGVKPELADSIFDLFVQSDVTLERASGGMGLGLTLVRAIARLHGGRVRLEPPVPGEGAEFVVRLPRIQVDAEIGTDAADSSNHTELSVLVIEDLEDSREALATILELDGHTVCTAANGSEGLALANQIVPDLILCDIGLPELDGYEVARGVRSNARLDRTRLIALTGYGTQGDVEAARGAGFDAHLTKPLQPDLLAETISRLTG